MVFSTKKVIENGLCRGDEYGHQTLTRVESQVLVCVNMVELSSASLMLHIVSKLNLGSSVWVPSSSGLFFVPSGWANGGRKFVHFTRTAEVNGKRSVISPALNFSFVPISPHAVEIRVKDQQLLH